MKNIIIKKKDFEKEYGFSPINMLDYLTLLWDASDNIPGLEWVGKKTSSNLIQNYANIDNIYQNLNELTPSLKDKFIQNKKMVYNSMNLIKLYDVPDLNFILNNYKFDIDFDLWRKFLVEEYWFNSINKNLKDLEIEYKKWEQLSLF
jgi:DNA polymerase-1